MQVLLQDLRFAFRQILRNPGFSLTAVLSLTLGIGATVAVYSILYDAVLHPWPYAGIDRICDVWITDNAGHEFTPALTGPQILQLRQTHVVEDVPAFDYTSQTVTGSDLPDDATAIMMTGSAFQFLGLSPLLGRYIVPSDAPDGQDPQPVAVLSYKFWQRHYRGDPAVAGKTIQPCCIASASRSRRLIRTSRSLAMCGTLKAGSSVSRSMRGRVSSPCSLARSPYWR